jgi:dihydroflavonol-4-reductase
VVFHAAAVHALWAKDPEAEILRPAIEGTTNAIVAARRAGVRRVVLTSSCNAVGFTLDATQRPDETVWKEGARMAYAQAKIRSERAAFERAAAEGIELVSVLPTGILGPGDRRITPTTRYLRDLVNGTAPLFASGGVNVVDARDVARAHVLAATKGRAGERYLIGGEDLTYEALGALVAELTGTKPKTLGLPRWALMGAAALMEAGAKLTGREPGLTRAMIHDGFGRYSWFDIGKARRELGFAAAPAREVVLATVVWLLERGALLPAAAERTRARGFVPVAG